MVDSVRKENLAALDRDRGEAIVPNALSVAAALVLVFHGMSTDEAVAHGTKITAGVVTSAAVVMVLVFSVFATSLFDLLKQFGVGLAAAILIDATIVRAVLLPATMKLLGDWNWYLRSWLQWLPRIAVATEPDSVGETPAVPAAR